MKKFFLKQNTKNGRKSGFTLVETLVAISIFSLSILSVMAFMSQSPVDTRYAENKMRAAYLAQEGIEYLRNIRDNYMLFTSSSSLTWSNFVSKVSSCAVGSECGVNVSLPPTDPNSVFLCSSDPNQCKLYVDGGNYNNGAIGVDSGLVRKISVQSINQNEMEIFSTVSFNISGKSYSVTFSEVLFNWAE